MQISQIHAYFTGIKLDPTLGWDMLETDLDDVASEVRNAAHLRELLAKYASMYIDMAQDDDDHPEGGFSTFYTSYVVPLLMSDLPLTMDEQRLILGTAAWFGMNSYTFNVRGLLTARAERVPVLPPSEA